jgi:uncharacterized protein
LFHNSVLGTSLLAFTLAQSMKVLTHRAYKGEWDFKQLVASGGLPSSHSALIASLTMAVGLQEGFGEPLFAACFVLCVIVRSPPCDSTGPGALPPPPLFAHATWKHSTQVMYDACGVRLQAGKQAEVRGPTRDSHETFLFPR